MLYQLELNEGAEPSEPDWFWSHGAPSKKGTAFTEKLVRATTENRAEIDARLTAALENWKLSRLSVVVRNLLRLGVAEMIYMDESPYQVVINEAVELARDFMDEESAPFVNGVLERCRLAAPLETSPSELPSSDNP